jgi:hypothetical protein
MLGCVRAQPRNLWLTSSSTLAASLKKSLREENQMSTPEDRLREKAQELLAQKEARQKQEAEERARRQAELARRVQLARDEARAWLNRLQELIKITRLAIPHLMDDHLNEGPGFELRVGTAVFRAILDEQGWRVVQLNPPDLFQGDVSPDDLSAVRDLVLERMVEVGMKDLIDGKVPPESDLY